MDKWTITLAFFAVWGFGVVLGVSYTKEQIGRSSCEARTYNSYEILPDWSLRCFSVMTIEEIEE